MAMKNIHILQISTEGIILVGATTITLATVQTIVGITVGVLTGVYLCIKIYKTWNK